MAGKLLRGALPRTLSPGLTARAGELKERIVEGATLHSIVARRERTENGQDSVHPRKSPLPNKPGVQNATRWSVRLSLSVPGRSARPSLVNPKSANVATPSLSEGVDTAPVSRFSSVSTWPFDSVIYPDKEARTAGL